MKFRPLLGFVAALLLPSVAWADRYTGVVSEIKHFKNGGIAVDLEGNYPNEKMELYLPADSAAKINELPPESSKVTATGTISSYKSTREIKIYRSLQWKW